MTDLKDATKLIIKAAKKGEVAVIRMLLDHDANLLTARDTDGSTPLHCAAWKGHEGVAAELLKRGAPVSIENENDHWGGTPLHAAAHANNAGIVRLLLEHGADATAVSRNGRTPMQETEFHNATASAKVLLQSIANRDAAR